MALDKLLATDNFEFWLAKINEIIDSLGDADTLANDLLRALDEAITRNQATEYLETPSGTITFPDGTTANAGNYLSWDWNQYYRNGVYWIPWASGTTSNPPLGQQKSGMCWVASGGENGPVIQLAAAFKDHPSTSEQASTPTLALRFGENSSGSLTWRSWIEIPNRKYLDDNFLNKVKNELQTVVAKVSFQQDVSVAEDLTVEGKGSIHGPFAFKGDDVSVIAYPDDSCHASAMATRHMTLEVGNGETFVADTTPNLPLWSTATGSYVAPEARTRYVEPFWIDKQEKVANINGTAEYANFIVPANMVAEFKSGNIPASQLWMPAAAKAVKDLYDWAREELLSKSGGTVAGVVRHEQDIFLEHLQGIQENRTAAIRSVVRPLQMQCQGSTHLVSNSKQACLYLEKEDADSAEYTTEHHDASFTFRKVVPDLELCVQGDPNFQILNSDPELDGYWDCSCYAGRLKLFANGNWQFKADTTKKSQLQIGETLKLALFYKVENAVSGESIANRCQYDIVFHPGDPDYLSGNLTVNDVHYQIAVTDTDWLGLPIAIKSRLATGSNLVDGSTIAAGSIINGVAVEEDMIVIGLQTSYGVKDDEGEETPAMLAEGSIIKSGSILVTDTIVNGQRWTNTSRVNSDIRVAAESTLAKGSILKSGSTIGLNSVINGFQYTQPEEVNGQDITEPSDLEVGSKILLGSLISTASAINGVPGRAGFYEVLYGKSPNELQGELTNGSIIAQGTVLAPGSVVNEVVYDAPMIVSHKTTVNRTAKIGHGSKLAAGSWIEAGSFLNGLKWANGMYASGIDAVVPLGKEDIAPILYTRQYDNINGKWDDSWQMSSYRTIFPNETSFDATMWENWLTSQINSILLQDENQEIRQQVLNDLHASMTNAERSWTYPLRGNVDQLLVHGAWTLEISYWNSPNHVFETRCYVASNSRSIGVERITVEPFKFLYDDSGARVGVESVHDAAVIFNNSNSIAASFNGQAFEYFNFSVNPGFGAEYSINYDTRLIPEQVNINAEKVTELLVFKAYAGTIDASGAPVATFEKVVSLNVSEMFGAPFVFGARTRTGITSTGQLGDPLYDLGCIEISEDSMAFKLRKRSVTMQSEIKRTASIVFERTTDYSGEINTGIALRPSVNGVDLGTGDLRFRNLYLEGEPIVSSDKNLKTDFADIPESILTKWGKVKWVSFKFKDAVERKGKKARMHTGVVAQDVQKALRGVDVTKWSFFCKDKWEDRKETEFVEVPAGTDEFGIYRDAHTERRIVVSNKSGEQYSIRYQEMQCIENAYLRREIELLKKEIEILKQKVK